MVKDKGARVLFAAIFLILTCAVVAFWFYFDHAGPQQPLSTEVRQALPLTSPQSVGAPMKTPLPATGKAEADADYDYEQEDLYSNREVKARLAQVADIYAEQIQYPAFSMPIQNQEALRKYLPNRSIDAERPLDMEEENSPRLRLQTDKHQYFTGDIIKVTVSVTGLTGDPSVKVGARLVAQGQTLATAGPDAVDQQAGIYRMSFADLDAIADSGTGVLRVVARINIDGEAYEIGTPVSYTANVATVTDVDMAQVSGEYLNIPVKVTTTKPGYHELGANLYSAQSYKPLVHLTAQQELLTTNGLMQLQAHIASLKVGGDPGPYLLKDISFTRMPSPPDFITEYGNASQDSYPVNGYAFDQYDDVPYADEEALKRLELLRQLGSVD